MIETKLSTYLLPLVNILIASLSVYLVANVIHPLSFSFCIGLAVVLMGLTMPPRFKKITDTELLEMGRSRFGNIMLTLIIISIWWLAVNFIP